MRKLVYGALALGAALILSVANPSADGSNSVKAVEATTGGVTAEFKSVVKVDSLVDDNLVLDAGSAKEVMVGTAKVSKGKTGSVIKVAAWDTYEVKDGQVIVDLSKIATTKDNYIRIKADSEADSDAITIKLPAASSKLKATYDKEKEAIVLTDNKAPVAKDISLCWRTVNGEISRVSTQEGGIIDDKSEEISLETYRMSGGVIYLRTMQTADPADWTKGNDAEGILEEDGTTPVYVVTGPVRSSKELKVTIAKRANAPKLSVNYVNGTISIPAKAQYRVLNTTGATLPEFKAATTAKITLTLGAANDEEKNIIDASNPFAIDVMTAKDGKKPASKIGHTTFDAQKVTDATEVAVKDVVAATKAEKDGTWTATVSLVNNSKTETYALVYTPAGTTKEKTVKIAAGKTATATKVVTASAVTLQRIGNTKTKSWAGIAMKFDDINALKSGSGSVDGPVATPKYALTVDNSTLASLVTYTVTDEQGKTLDVAAIPQGTKVYVNLTSTAISGCKITSSTEGVSPQKAETAIDGATNSYYFEMPAGDVTVTVGA